MLPFGEIQTQRAASANLKVIGSEDLRNLMGSSSAKDFSTSLTLNIWAVPLKSVNALTCFRLLLDWALATCFFSQQDRASSHS